MKTKIHEETKKSLIDDIKSRLEDGILEKSNADLIIKLINNADDLNEAINIAALGTTYKRTGFHFDKRLEKLGNTIKYFKKNNKLSFEDLNNKKVRANVKSVGANTCGARPNHKLIIGDNYDALQNLLIEYKNKIDVIYIDPPYSKDKMGNFAHVNYDNEITRDNLLSMLFNRLVLARELMSEEGVIFCSIDDRNHAYVKCLFDDIFGESNFVTSFVWQKKKGGGQAKYIYEGHEYILCYCKSKKNISGLYTIDNKKGSDIIEKDGKIYRINDDIIRAVFGKYEKGTERRCHYEDILKVKGKKKFNEVREKIKTGEYILKKSLTDNKKHYVCKLEEITDGKYKIVYTILTGYIDGIRTEHGNNEITNMGLVFDDPKPIELIKIVLSMTKQKDSVILDFFAGSGTTGQAVLELNKEDGGNRQFILCQLNEITDTTPNGIAIDVTTKRLRRIMTGKCYDGKNNFEWIKKNEPLGGSLDVYDIATVANFESTKNKSPFEVIDETLYGQEKFKNIQDKIKWVCENFEHTQKIEE